MTVWDPGQYLRFGDFRLRPALDLLAHIPDVAPNSVWDLGCGTGNVTRLLAERWPASRVSGLDYSPEMLAKAKAIPGIDWVHADIALWSAPSPADVIYSNATLQWLPGHGALLPHLLSQLRPGGILAVQMPRNNHAPSHQAIIDAIGSGSWRNDLQPMIATMPSAEDPDAYYHLLAGIADLLDIWETEYLQVLDGENAVAEWTKGSVLKPFLDALAPRIRQEFYEDYARRVSMAYPRQPDGRTLLPFRRLFVVAKR